MAETTTLKALREAVAGQLGLLTLVTIDTDTDPVFVINDLADKSPDPERLRDFFLYQAAVWRRIVSLDATGTNVTVTRTSAITTGAAQIYNYLDPDELNAAINEALKELYYVEKEAVTVIADTKVYSLPTWIQQRGQILNVKWRDISVLATQPLEEEIEGYAIREDANVCTLYVHDTIRDATTYDIQVYGRRNHQALASDAATTTCPYPLIFAVSMVKVLHKIFTKYGKGVATLFGQKMVVAEGELVKAKADWLPRLAAREYVDEDGWRGVDDNQYFNNPSW